MTTITDIGVTGEGTEELKLLHLVDQFYADPLGFVRTCFKWGEPGTPLEHFLGPDEWQCQELREIGLQVQERAFDGHTPVSPIRRAVASGHGIGKSALTAWIVLWLMSTRPDSRGTVTANTYVQLETKTWAAIQKWLKLCLTAHWFVCTTNRLYHRDSKETWFCSPATCKEENSEAFAGQHAADASSFYVFDEASAVPDKIFEVAERASVYLLVWQPDPKHRQVLPRVLWQRARRLGTQGDRLSGLPVAQQ